MRTKVTILFSMLYSLFFYAQSTMNIHQNNGDVLKIPLNTIDSVTYTIFNSDNTPIIQSVTIEQIPALNGTNIKFKIVVSSISPVDWLNSSFYGPSGNLYGGGSGIQFSETSKGIWEYTRTDFVSKWSPSGEYYYSGISVKNAAELTSKVWSYKVSTKITNSEIATTPIIQNVSLQQSSTSNGTDVKFNIIVASNAPVDWLNSSFYGPNGNIYGGGSGIQFSETSKGIWEYTRTDFVSKWSPSGEYYYNGISVKNQGELKSNVWSKPVSIKITNLEIAKTPVIKSITLEKVSKTDGTDIKLKIIVESNAPVNWLNSSFYGPSGNLSGGGSGVMFTETSKGIWEYNRTDFVSKWSPSGEYYYSGVSVENEGKLKSTVWTGSLKTSIMN
jgi:hypothetical protein